MRGQIASADANTTVSLTFVLVIVNICNITECKAGLSPISMV